MSVASLDDSQCNLIGVGTGMRKVVCYTQQCEARTARWPTLRYTTLDYC